jgi:hypothetical protein
MYWIRVGCGRRGWAMISMTATLLACATVLVASPDQRDVAVHDGFESARLSEHWDTRKFIPGAVQIQSEVVRAGSRAAAITLREGDQIPQEAGSELERAELREPRRLWAIEGSEYEYSFSVFLPQSFPVVPTRLVIAQWKHECPIDTCRPDNPTLAIRYEGGELFIAKQITARKEILYRARTDVRNRWLDFRVRIRFSRNQSGRIKAWLGDAMVIDHEGATAYPKSGGYEGRGQFYFKVGLYRDRMAEPMTLYVDEYRKERLRD